MHAVFPVAAGLAAGIMLLFVVSTMFPLYHDYTPRPGIHAKEAVRIASEDSTLQALIGNLDAGMKTSRDYGVAGTDCPPYWCAIVLVYDGSDPKTVFYAVNVNVRDEKVAGIYISRDLLIAQTEENVEEVKAFLSRHLDAEADVQVGPDGKTLTYSVLKIHRGAEDPTRTLSVIVKTTYSGQVTSVYAQCNNEKVTGDVAEFVRTTDCLAP